jgi:hypothetical protein
LEDWDGVLDANAVDILYQFSLANGVTPLQQGASYGMLGSCCSHDLARRASELPREMWVAN